MKHKDKTPGCAVCGARIESYVSDDVLTCDRTCSRALAAGRTRGKQMELEVRAVARLRPEPEQELDPRGLTGFGYRPENDYNQPFRWAAA